uniref:DUF659 domain-containing protein n=1 Tax=Hyaloperonospora arabidopsidis (strain Emoy2) TaxID=559515 RepID=M4BS14_HYAAE
MDGAANVLSSSISNIIAHAPWPWFVEYLWVDLKKESADELLMKIKASIDALQHSVGQKVVNGSISDSCNVTRCLRDKLVEEYVVEFSYGCAAHPINNLVEDLIKVAPFKIFHKQTMFLSKVVKYQGRLSKTFSVICKRSLGVELIVLLLSPSCWRSVNYMFQCLRNVMRPMSEMPLAIRTEKEQLGIDPSFSLPPAFAEIMRDDLFWEGDALSADLLGPLFKCIGVLESYSVTMRTSYTCFFYMLDHLTGVISDYDGQREYAIQSLVYRLKRLYIPFHALTFLCDPFYSEFRLNSTRHHGSLFVKLGMGKLRLQCLTALALMARQHDVLDGAELLVQFFDFCVHQEACSRRTSP